MTPAPDTEGRRPGGDLFPTCAARRFRSTANDSRFRGTEKGFQEEQGASWACGGQELRATHELCSLIFPQLCEVKRGGGLT